MVVCELYYCSVKYRQAVVMLAVALMVLTGYAAYQRNSVWNDRLTLWTDVTRKSPGKTRGWTELILRKQTGPRQGDCAVGTREHAES